MDRLFPTWLFDILKRQFLLDNIFEIRIRLNKPIVVNYLGSYKLILSDNGYIKKPFLATRELIEYILSVATKQSVYAYNDEMKQLFLSYDGGIRIGLCGTVIYDGERVLSLKNISSLCIRFAHEIIDCSKKVINVLCSSEKVKNTLIISPPGMGKTTMVRDISRLLSDTKKIDNILIVDERFEIAGSGEKMLETGQRSDVLSGCKKSFAFDYALKTMNPKVIITDEISSENDIEAIKRCIRSGVSVIATAHSDGISSLKTKPYFEYLIKEKYFERIVQMSASIAGKVDAIFDENLRAIYYCELL